MNPRTNADRSVGPPSDAAVLAEQVRLLYDLPVLVVANLAVAPVTAALLWPIYPKWVPLYWIGAFLVVIAGRALLWQRYQRQRSDTQNPRTWARRFAFGSFVTGCLWGLLMSVVFMTDDPTYYVFVMFVLGGMIAGAALRDSAYLPAFYAFAAPALLPMIVALVLKTGATSSVMGLLLTAFAGAFLLIGHENNRRITDNIRLKIEQAGLNSELEGVAADLRKEIADHEKAAFALQESNARLRGIGENAQDAIVITNADGNVIYWNPAAERIFGYTADEITGHSVHKLLVPERQRAKAIEGYKRFSTTGQGPVVGKTLPLGAIRRDGSEVPIELSVSAMPQGNTWQAVGIARDVSRRMQAETALRQREAELKEAQHLANLAGWTWLRDGNAVKWSDELYQMFRRDPGLPAPSIEEHSQLVTRESHERMMAAFRACQEDGTPVEVDLEAGQIEGAPEWISIRGKAERDASGQVTRIYATVQDISVRKKSEQNIARLHTELAAKVDVLRRHEQETTAIGKLNDILQACHSRAEAYPVIAATANGLFRQTDGALSLVVGGSRELETVAQWGAVETMSAGFTFDDCWALRTGQKYQIDKSDEGAICRHFKTAPRGPYVCLPLTVAGETTGLLHLNVAADSAVDEELQRLMVTFGDVVKLSLSNLGLRERLSEQAMRDQLTTLFNRHYLAETLPREIHRARRDNTTLSVAMMDIDHFKSFNDTHGHEAGDVVLKEVGLYLRATLRAGDIACRYGGEEFILVLPECNLNDAQRRLQQICQELKRKTFMFRRKPLPSVSFSVGISQLSETLPTAETLIAAADEALYTAKRSGRDRIEIVPVDDRQTAPVPAA